MSGKRGAVVQAVIRYFAPIIGLGWMSLFGSADAWAQRIDLPIISGSHVAELARYLDAAEIYDGIDYQQLSVFPVRLRGGDQLAGNWLTMDQALEQGQLVILEKPGGGQVPWVSVANRSREAHVFIMAGELLSGGKQARTVRQDVVVAPGGQVQVPVFCVERRRWEGESQFQAARSLLPQSIYRELRQGADQQRIWDEVARNNAALDAENATGSLELALRDQRIGQRLTVVRERIFPQVPDDAVGFLFVVGNRAAGAEFFGRRDIARRLLPKLIDSYTIDVVIKAPGRPWEDERRRQQAAIEWFERIRRAGSQHTGTPGAGDGIRSRAAGLSGDGVGLDGRLVHFGVHPGPQVVPRLPVDPENSAPR